MDEIRKNHIVQIFRKNNSSIIDGIVIDYAKDRVMILISDSSIEDAKTIKELDDLMVIVHTHLGFKKMYSSVISELNTKNCIIIENSPTISVVQKREFVRVLSKFNLTIMKDSIKTICQTANISAGGVAFHSYKNEFNINDIVTLVFPSIEFEKEINVKAQIIKKNNNTYVAKYINLNKYDEDKITKYVFKLITDK